MSSMLALAVMVGIASAQEVVLPAYTPQSTSDFGAAEDLTEATRQALSDRGLAYAAALDVSRRVGPSADACWDLRECVELSFERFGDARIAIVGRVGWEDGRLSAMVRFYVHGDTSPVEVIMQPVDPESMDDFTKQLAATAADLLELLPPREEPAPVPVVEPDPEPDPEPHPGPTPEQLEREERHAAEDLRKLDLERRSLGLPRYAFDRYKASGEPYEEWSVRNGIRARRGVIEIHVGAGGGDVDRRYDTRVWVEQDDRGGLSSQDVYEYETFLQGTALETGMALGYLPTWWLEVGIFGGVQLGKKQLTTGWEQTEEGSDELVDYDNRVYDPALAMLGVITPRLRFYTVPMGVVKPYLLAGFTARFHDGYSVPDLALIDYPDRGGGLSYGPTAGAGVAFDIPGYSVILVEIPWTYLVAPDPYVSDSGLVQRIPEQLVGSYQLLSARVAFGLRF